MELLLGNISTIIVALLVILLVAVIIMKLAKDKKQGKSSCGCNCGGCPNSSICHQKK